MENVAYEEEQTELRRREIICDQHKGFITDSSQQITRESVRPICTISNSDAHVYEEVLVNENISHFTDTSSFWRNFTLPLFRGAVIDTSAVTSNNGTTCPDADLKKSICENKGQSEDCILVVNAEDTTSHISPECFTQVEEVRPSKKRRKRDCKYCRNKAREREFFKCQGNVNLRKRDHEDACSRANESGLGIGINTAQAQTILAADNFGMLPGPRMGNTDPVPGSSTSSTTAVFSISETSTVKTFPNASDLTEIKISNSITDLPSKIASEEKTLVIQDKTATGMRVNSIYSQDRWYTKEAQIFFTDVNDCPPFQRTYSLPVPIPVPISFRSQSPVVQNRVNLRRSVRGEPPPEPARLSKNRRGWTLHFVQPLKRPGCNKPMTVLLVVILALLGIGAIALYIVCEPEKLRVIQQYLKSMDNSSSLKLNTSIDQEATVVPRMMTMPITNQTIQSIISSISSTGSLSSNGSSPFSIENTTEPLDLELSGSKVVDSSSNDNYTRYCDDCLPGEVCVALIKEEVPICRLGIDSQDPTGCAGLCIINKQRCHRLDVDAFRCLDIEHYCLHDEWTCSNTLCIPLKKRCDGHMNCYDHSDELDCECDLNSSFHCGNETSCLPLEKKCDGIIDCWDAADEINCTLACPVEDEFTCSNGQCILKSRFCDGLPDCADQSDEPHGCQGRCNKHEFTCENSRCITKGMRCNGKDDCGDGSDERYCRERKN